MPLRICVSDLAENPCKTFPSELQCRRYKTRNASRPAPVENRRLRAGSVSDHRTYHRRGWSTWRTARQRGLQMKLNPAETAKRSKNKPKKFSKSFRIREVEGSNPFESTIKQAQFRCRRLNAYGIKRFRGFYPLNFHQLKKKCTKGVL